MRLGNTIRPNSTALLSISIGQEDQTGLAFSEMVAAVKDAGFSCVSILKADSLQRHRVLFSLENVQSAQDDAVIKECERISDDWDLANQATVMALKTHFPDMKVLSWDDVTSHASFAEEKAKVEELYKNNKDFRHQVDGAAANFTRKTKEKSKQPRDTIFNSMKDYLIEESAGLLVLGKMDPSFDYEIYKGKRNRAMACAYKELGCYGNVKAVELREDVSASYQSRLFPSPAAQNDQISSSEQPDRISLIRQIDLLTETVFSGHPGLSIDTQFILGHYHSLLNAAIERAESCSTRREGIYESGNGERSLKCS